MACMPSNIMKKLNTSEQERSYEGKKMYLLYVKFRGNSFENLQKLTFYLVTIKIMTITENKVMSIFP